MTGSNCACADNGAPQRFPGVERIIVQYIGQCVNSGQPWYITPQVNSNTYSPQEYNALSRTATLGGDTITTYDDGTSTITPTPSPSMITDIINIASSIGTAALNALPAIASTVGTLEKLQTGPNTLTAAQQALASKGIVLPGQVVAAAIPAATGALPSSTLIYLGLAAMFVLLVMGN